MHGFDIPLVIAAIGGCGLMSGLFFAFSVFVMQALGSMPAPQGMLAMQQINRKILRPLFYVVFFGTTLCCAALLLLPLWLPEHRLTYSLTAAGSLAYLVGGFVVTAACNVPLNNRLDGLSPEESAGTEFWSQYQSQWMRWNHLRTLSCLFSTVLFALSLATA